MFSASARSRRSRCCREAVVLVAVVGPLVDGDRSPRRRTSFDLLAVTADVVDVVGLLVVVGQDVAVRSCARALLS